jgi:serine/threonine-protein kinase
LHPGSSQAERIDATLTGADVYARAEEAGRAVPPELLAICEQALKPEAGERYGSARELHDAIERFLDGHRNEELRRELAQRHAENAAATATRIDSDDSATSRRRSMREVGRALALDPDNEMAMSTLLRLLEEPADELPQEVERQLERSSSKTFAKAAPLIVTAFPIPMIAIALTIYWMGIRSTLAATALFGLVALAPITAAASIGRPAMHRFPGALVMHLGASVLWCAVTSVVFGPLVMIPGLAALQTGLYVTGVRGNRIRSGILVGCATFLVPFALQWLGVLPPSYRFESDGLRILPGLTNFPASATTAFLLVTGITQVVVAAVGLGRLRAALDQAEARVAMHAWQLRQLLPEHAGRG